MYMCALVCVSMCDLCVDLCMCEREYMGMEAICTCVVVSMSVWVYMNAHVLG